MVLANYTTTKDREQQEKSEVNFSESLPIKHSGILYLKVNYKLRDKIKNEIMYYVRSKTVPNKELLLQQKKISKDFGFHLAIRDIWYPNADLVMSDILVLELSPNLTNENFSDFYFSVRTLEGVFSIIGTKVPVDKGTLTFKTKYHTLPTYIAKGEFANKVVLNKDKNLSSGTKVYLPKYNKVGEIYYFDKGSYFIKVGDKILPYNLKDFNVIGSLYERVTLINDKGTFDVSIKEINKDYVTCVTKSNKVKKVSVNNFINWRI